MFRLQNSRIFCERKRRGKYSNDRSGASVETARENARGSREDHAYGALRLPKREENDCFTVYAMFGILMNGSLNAVWLVFGRIVKKDVRKYGS